MSEAQRVGLGQRQQPRSFPSHISRLMHFTCIFTKSRAYPAFYMHTRHYGEPCTTRVSEKIEWPLHKTKQKN